jgi:hypothetical protein
MALVLPSSIDYKQSLPALPDSAVQIPVAASPVNGTQFSAGQQIQFDLLNRGFLVPDSMYISYSWTIAKGAAAADDAFFRATPVYSTFNRLDVQIGSQTVETIQNYGLVMHLLTNTQYDVAQKYGLQTAFGYGVASGGVPSLEQLDGRGLPAATSVTGSFSAPLVSMLSNSEKLLPLFAMPQIRVTLSVDNLTNTFNTVANGVTAYTLANVELRYKVVDMGGAVENIVLSMGDKLYIKSQSFACSSQTLPASIGYNELVFNSRFASVKSLYAVNGSASVNGFYDSIDLTSNTGDYSFMIGGVMYPQKPISAVTAKAQALMELKSAVGSIFDKSNNMSINSIEFAYVANPAPTTTFAAPGKYFIGTSTEKLNSDSLLTGISTQNSPISYRINTGSNTTNSSTVSLIVNYDALIEVDTLTRQASVKA